MLGSKYNFTTSGAVADSIKVYETGTTAKIAFISDSVLTSLPEITIQFTPKDNGQKFTDKLLVTDSLEIRQVLFEHLGNALPLSNQFYSIKNNEISFFPGQKILKSDVLILGIKGNVRIPGEDIIISGLEKFTGANMIVYNANNRTSPIRTISGTLKWDCKDNTGTSVTPGVYLLVININDGSGKVLNNQIIIK
jgi:hypothetical protein